MLREHLAVGVSVLRVEGPPRAPELPFRSSSRLKVASLKRPSACPLSAVLPSVR